MATKQEKQQAVERYLNSPRVPKPVREEYSDGLWNSKILTRLSYAAGALFLPIALYSHFSNASDVAELHHELANAPARIDDVGERYWSKETPPVFHYAIGNAVRSTLEKQEKGLGRAVLRMPQKGNDIPVLRDAFEDIRVDPASVAIAYRRNIEQATAEAEATLENDDDQMKIVGGLIAIAILRTRSSREKRIQVALDHFGVK